jgi:cytoskeletal protein CcmA (bactofilin family)
MKTLYKFLAVFSLLAILMLTFAKPAQAFDSRTGETIVIKADEVINDDLYVTANNFTLDGTVKGDLVVFGTVITINGTVEGDLIAAGQSVVINGKVMDDARIAGAVLQVGDKASIGDDLISAGASLEVKKGSQVGGDLVVGTGQALLAGDVANNVLAGAGSLELRGNIGGNVKAEVGDPNQDTGGSPMSMFFPKSEVPIPNVLPGFTISENAKIKGNLEYTQTKDIQIPANVVGGKVTRTQPVADPAAVPVQPTPAEAAMTWMFDLLRTIATLVIIGLFLGWLAPTFTKTLTDKIQTKPAASFGWGLVSFAAFFFAILLVIVVMVIGGILFGMLTLGGLTATIIWLGILAIFALAIFFVLATAFITKITVAWLGGKLILTRINPALAENKFAPLILGVVILALLMAIPFIGWIFSTLAVLMGLGAIWMWGSEFWQSRKTAQEVIPA